MIDTNVKGMMYVTTAVVPFMIENEGTGHIINIGSTAGSAAYGGGAVYCSSKAAVQSYTDALRIDLIETKIRVTNIKPGMVETEFSNVRFKGDKKKAKEVYKGIEPLTPDDVASIITYAVSLPENVQITDLTVTANHQADGRNVYRKKKYKINI